MKKLILPLLIITSAFSAFSAMRAQQINVDCFGGSTACFWFDFSKVPSHVTPAQLGDYLNNAAQLACNNNLSCNQVPTED